MNWAKMFIRLGSLLAFIATFGWWSASRTIPDENARDFVLWMSLAGICGSIHLFITCGEITWITGLFCISSIFLILTSLQWHAYYLTIMVVVSLVLITLGSLIKLSLSGRAKFEDKAQGEDPLLDYRGVEEK